MKIAIVGAGAIGSFFGAKLALAGNDVSLVAREQHVQAIRRSGLRLYEGNEVRTIAINAVTSSHELAGRDFDLVIITTKAYDAATASKIAVDLLQNNTIWLSIQNGLGMEEVISKATGKSNFIKGVTYCGATLDEPGTVTGHGVKETILGYSKAVPTDSVKSVKETFELAGLPAHVTSNILGAIWLKVLVNSGINALATVTNSTNGQLLESPTLRNLMLEIVREGFRVAQKSDIKLEADAEQLVLETAKMTSLNRNSMLVDIEKGKRTEIDFINGAICVEGRRLGVDTPLNAMLTALIKGMEEQNRMRAR